MGSYSIEVLETSEGLRNARIHAGGKSYTLHSSQPLKEAERIVNNFNPEMEWVLVAGFGMGHVISYVLEHTSFKIIVFEPDEDILELAGKSPDIKKVIADPRVNIIKNDIARVIDFLEDKGIRELTFYIHRPYFSIFPDAMASLEGIIAAYLSKKQINKTTLKRFQKVWLRNIIKNSSYYFNLPGINDISHNFRDKPAVIIGAGPSLALNIDIIKKFQDKAVIISTDTAYINLCSFGIKPDFIVSVDPQDKNSLYLLYAFDSSSKLVIDSAASFISFVKYNPLNLIIYDSIFPIYNDLKYLWGEKGQLACGGSVSTTAFDLARFLKCDPIIFTGQDLSYPGRRTHIKGSILEEFLYSRINRFDTYENYNSKMLLLSDRIEIDGWNGTRVHTDRKFLTFLDWFKKEIKETGASVINSTEGGAIIQGASHMTLEKALGKACGGSLNKEVIVSGKERDQSPFIELLKELKDKILKMEDLAKKAFYASKRAVSKFKSGSNAKEEFGLMTEFDAFFLKSFSGGGEGSKNKPVIARLLEFTMQGSIEMISNLSAGADLNIDTLEAWSSLYSEAADGLAYIKRLIDKRLDLSPPK
jgi:hypothetical protein